MTIPYRIRIASWQTDRKSLRAIREAVFVDEQKVPVELEWDEEDVRCVHVLAEASNGAAIGTGRLLPDGHVGRMAVLQPWRRRGVGSALLVHLVDLAKRSGRKVLRLHAQSYVADFYRRHGFIVEGEEFMEAGIPHRYMTRIL
ncbi:MAG: GNAT family N-acetyltransferase [Burkholderiales bacterium]